MSKYITNMILALIFLQLCYATAFVQPKPSFMERKFMALECIQNGWGSEADCLEAAELIAKEKTNAKDITSPNE